MKYFDKKSDNNQLFFRPDYTYIVYTHLRKCAKDAFYLKWVSPEHQGKQQWLVQKNGNALVQKNLSSIMVLYCYIIQDLFEFRTHNQDMKFPETEEEIFIFVLYNIICALPYKNLIYYYFSNQILHREHYLCTTAVMDSCPTKYYLGYTQNQQHLPWVKCSR